MNILENSWVIGIVTGLISGAIVYFITSKIISKKEKREFDSHVREANKEVVNALKPYIAEQGLPRYEVFMSLIVSIARKYNVSTMDLLMPSEFCREIIGEILCDVYISSDNKKRFTEDVAKYMEDCEDDERFDYEKPDMEHNNIKKRIYEYSALFSIIAALVSAFSIWWGKDIGLHSSTHNGYHEILLTLFSFPFIGVIILIIGIIIFTIVYFLKSKR